jgi:hypothetical protein
VSARDFPVEPADRAPADGDGKIPSAVTPAGARIAAPRRCTVRFSGGAGRPATAVNSWISAHQNKLTARAVVCLAGTFTTPVHVWGKTSTALLELAPAPGARAVLRLGTVTPADVDPNEYWGEAGGVSLVDSRSVEVYGLTIEDFRFDGTGQVPAGIDVTVRSDTAVTRLGAVPHRSACFTRGRACSDIYLIRNTIRHIVNTADQDFTDRKVCGNGNVDAYGIAVIAAGRRGSPALQHLVIEDNTVSGTRTGQSETVTINGDVTDFLAAGNVIHDTDNIGLDTIGWELGPVQARHGLVQGNTVYNVDTYSNAAYGVWRSGRCAAQDENAAGLYDDGASYVWLRGNRVWNSDQGINLDVETAGRETDHLLVSGNTVTDDPGTSRSDPSFGANPPGTPGRSTVAGHDPFALYIDAFGRGAAIRDVYAHDNTLRNRSQYYLTPSAGMPTVDLGGKWSDVQVWHNTIAGGGRSDRYNPLLEVDTQPTGGTNVINCNDYRDPSAAPGTVNGNFALPHADWLTLAAWQTRNGHHWDADSAAGRFPVACPARSRP